MELLVRADADESGALKLPSLGTIGTIISLGVPVISGIIDHFKNSGTQQQQQQARELETLFARATVDQSGALSLEDAKNIASIGSSMVSAIHNIFSREELEQILARADVDQSGAFSLEDAKNVASIGSSIVSAFHNLFGG